MIEAYKEAVVYFILFSLLLLASSVVIFEHKIGFSKEGVLNYYLGNEELFIPAKSGAGIFKIILPHIFVFGLFAMVILHFVIFTKQKTKTKNLAYLLFISAFLEIFTPLLIINDFHSFAYLKLLSFFLFEILVIYILYILFFSIVYE
ncbi:MAG: hypothetical protein U9P72_04200 [Campylobacterota bacterium]|nr:hypothetical protein [Campylobacterota bacterium]